MGRVGGVSQFRWGLDGRGLRNQSKQMGPKVAWMPGGSGRQGYSNTPDCKCVRDSAEARSGEERFERGEGPGKTTTQIPWTGGLPPPPDSTTADPTQGPEQLQRTGNFTKNLILLIFKYIKYFTEIHGMPPSPNLPQWLHCKTKAHSLPSPDSSSSIGSLGGRAQLAWCYGE